MIQSPALANLTDRATVLSPDRGHVMTFDRDGRLVYFFRRGETFKRSLGSEVHLRFRKETRQRRRLKQPEALKVFAEVLGRARLLVPTTTGEVRHRLEEEILTWSAESLCDEKEKFGAAYKPISILPPDQYRSIVLQATEGCSWNGCTFCNFYMDRPFRLQTVVEFQSHVAAVTELLGKGMRLRQGVFLADGNALALANRRLDPLLDQIAEVFPDQEMFGFVDLYSGERRAAAEWRYLRSRGLRRVYLGMETGLDELLEFVNKPGSAEELEGLVGVLKEAGLEVSLIVMVGLGGREYRERHRTVSRDLLLRLPLNSRDLVYLSPFVEHPDSSYGRRRLEEGLTPMTEAEIELDLAALAGELRANGLRASRYDIGEFIY